jgi:hypothetical protein
MTRPLVTDLHFLSNAELLDLIARDHHAAKNNPAVLALRPELKRRESWAEIRDAGDRALETAAKEIARAKTEGEAQAATLRWEKYSKAIDDMNMTLFHIAERRLAEGASPTASGGHAGLLARGWLNVDAPESKLIPREHWAAGTMDWQRRHLRMDQTNKTWSGVEVFDLSELPPEIAAAVIGREAIDSDRPTVAQRDLYDFLAGHIQKLDSNSPELSQGALEQAAQYHFPENRIPREWVREWARKFMPEHLRKKPGRPALTK